MPQFPGGLMLRALEAALEAGGSDLSSVHKPGVAHSPDNRRRISNTSLSSALSLTSPGGGGGAETGGRSRDRGALNRETSRQNRERQQRAVHAMNDYMQQNSDLGSIFVVQYAKDAEKEPKPKTTPARGRPSSVYLLY